MITGDGHEGGCNVLTDRCIVEVLVLYSEAHVYDVTVNSRHGTLLCSYFLDPKLICEFFRLYAFHGLCNTHTTHPSYTP